MQAARLAVEFRHRFRVDVVIDLVCYRRHGHNELDDPTFTQPVMYREIREQPTVVTRYAERSQHDGVVGDGRAGEIAREIKGTLEDALSYARDFMPRQQVFALGGGLEGIAVGWCGLERARPRVGRRSPRDGAGAATLARGLLAASPRC